VGFDITDGAVGATGIIGSKGEIEVGESVGFDITDGAVGATGIIGSKGEIEVGESAGFDVTDGAVCATGIIGSNGEIEFGASGGDVIGLATIGNVCVGGASVGDNGVGATTDGEIGVVVTWIGAAGPDGNISLCTVKAPLTEAGIVHCAVRVMDWPGLRIRLAINCGSTPAFERQITLAFCVTKNPSMLGPSATVSF
jgi:hypothetical protein